MGLLKNLKSKEFGRLLVLERAGSDRRGEALWLCECVCGKMTEVLGHNLRSGHTQSCGCYHKEVSAKVNTTHGFRSHPLYKVWDTMKYRCYYPTCSAYKYYGERGIEICAAWHDFKTFLDFALTHGWKKGLTIERINVNGNYCPENCTFIPLNEQSKNRRNVNRKG